MSTTAFTTNTNTTTKEIKMTIEKTTRAFMQETDQLITTNFSKDDYLTWKSNWKYLYKELSKEIRIGKNMRKSSPNGYVSGLDYKRSIATNMMEYRTNMKEKSISLKKGVENVINKV